MSVTVQHLYVYPLKSARGIDMLEAEVTPRGLARDRLWMLVDDKGKFITQRQNPLLATVAPAFMDDRNLKFTAPNIDPLVVEESNVSPRDGLVSIWKDECQALAAPSETSEWFSQVLGQKAFLVRQNDSVPRPTDPRYSTDGDQVSFADGFPLLVTSASSLESLQRHFSSADIGMDRFRPNIVLEGLPPFAEDTMHTFKAGEIGIEMVKHCARCVMTTTDQQSGLRASQEPVKTLGQLRRAKQNGEPGVFFGVNAIPRNLGIIKAGDAVMIESTKPLGLTTFSGRSFLTATP